MSMLICLEREPRFNLLFCIGHGDGRKVLELVDGSEAGEKFVDGFVTGGILLPLDDGGRFVDRCIEGASEPLGVALVSICRLVVIAVPHCNRLPSKLVVGMFTGTEGY